MDSANLAVNPVVSRQKKPPPVCNQRRVKMKTSAQLNPQHASSIVAYQPMTDHATAVMCHPLGCCVGNMTVHCSPPGQTPQ